MDIGGILGLLIGWDISLLQIGLRSLCTMLGPYVTQFLNYYKHLKLETGVLRVSSKKKGQAKSVVSIADFLTVMPQVFLVFSKFLDFSKACGLGWFVPGFPDLDPSSRIPFSKGRIWQGRKPRTLNPFSRMAQRSNSRWSKKQKAEIKKTVKTS